ncbi:hypothetical protein LJB42_001552 [Komagataella kurtzmanii]|nr:hypothetical protein LJB42_001552 [Komagataella kurtzmanii]
MTVMVAASKAQTPDKKPEYLTFDTVSSPEERKLRFEEVFGVNKTNVSSRRDLSHRDEVKVIGGVRVPRKPIEPDNCCMSGCINCVWESFREDLKEWRTQTKQASHSLIAQGDAIKYKWPAGFDPPPKNLPRKYISEELRASNVETTEDPDAEDLPISIRVFAELEKKMKNKHKKLTNKQKMEGEMHYSRLEKEQWTQDRAGM